MFFSRFFGRTTLLTRGLDRSYGSSSAAGPSSSKARMLQHYPLFPRVSKSRIPKQERTPEALLKLNDSLLRAVKREDLSAVIRICHQLSLDGCRPNMETYEHILSALAANGLLEECWAIMADMEHSGFAPTVVTYNYLLEAAENVPESVPPILLLMKSHDVNVDAMSYEHIMVHFANFQNVPMCLQTLDEIYSKNLLPTLRTANMIIDCLCRAGMPQLALDVARVFDTNSARRLDTSAWLSVLGCSAEHLLAEGVQLGWHHAVVRGGITPTEPLITQILQTAAHNGLSELAHDAIRALRVRGQAPLEHHVAALLEALVQDDKIREAFAIVGHLRSDLGGMAKETTRALRAWAGQHPSHIDKAWALLEDIRRNQAPEPGNVSAVDIATLNAVIGGAIDLGDMQRAVGIYKESAAFGVAPDTETLNILLSGCIHISNRDLADSLISEMKDLGVVPDVDTYGSMIQLCLGQPSYEDVFYFLEGMKSAGFKPSMGIYEMIVQRCYDAFDPRWKVALTEMKEAGYETQHRFKSLIRERTGAESRD